MRSSPVSGAQTYKALVTAAKNERRNADLSRRRQYQRADPQCPSKTVEQPGRDRPQLQRQMPRGKVAPENRPGRKYWNCEGTDHLRSRVVLIPRSTKPPSSSWVTHHSDVPSSRSHLRCIQNRMGRIVPDPTDGRKMDTIGVQAAHQPPGAQGSSRQLGLR